MNHIKDIAETYMSINTAIARGNKLCRLLYLVAFGNVFSLSVGNVCVGNPESERYTLVGHFYMH